MEGSAQLQKEYEAITKKLGEKPPNLAELLIKRGSILAKLGQPAQANNDFLQAARIIETVPSQKTAQNVMSLRNVFINMSLGGEPELSTARPPVKATDEQQESKPGIENPKHFKVDNKIFNSTQTELVDLVLKLFDGSYITLLIQKSEDGISSTFDKNSLGFDKGLSLIQTIKYKLSLGQKLQQSQFKNILFLVVNMINLEQLAIKNSASDSINQTTSSKKIRPEASVYQASLYALLEVLEFDMDSTLEKSELLLTVLTGIWNQTIKEKDDTAFCELFKSDKTRSIYYRISTIYANSVYNVAKNSNPVSVSLHEGARVFFSYLFYYCTEFLEPAKQTHVVQSAIKIVSLANFGFQDIFVDKSSLIRLKSLEYPNSHNSTAPLVPRFLLQLFWIATSDSEELSTFANVLLTLVLQKFEDSDNTTKDTPNNEQYDLLLLYSTRIVSTWMQSVKQQDKSKGYRSLANIFLSQNSKLGPKMLTAALSVQSLFDEYENDSMQTNLSLLLLVDAIVNKPEYRDLVEEFGYNFLLYSISINKHSDKIKDYNELIASQVSIIGTKVLCKLAVSEAPQPRQGSNDDKNATRPNKSIIEQDLLDTYSLILEKRINDNADMIAHIAEGLGYLTLKSNLKNQISTSPVIIPELLRFIKNYSSKEKFEKNKALSIQFSLVSLLNNLVYRKPKLSDDEEAVESLRKATMKKGKDNEEDELLKELESAKFIDLRCASLSKIDGLLDLLVTCLLPKNKPSENIKDSVIAIFSSFACVLEIRGLLVQKGCVNAITENTGVLIDNSVAYPPQEYADKRDFNAAHTLSKLAVSLPPLIAFPSGGKVRINSLLVPFLKLCAYSGNDMLCVFEALMALTNFASLSFDPRTPEEETPSYLIVNKYKGLDIIEMLVLSEMCMIRRAATELICNLSASVESAFLYFIDGAEKVPVISNINDKSEIEKLSKNINAPFRSHKLHLLAALSDIDLDSDLSLDTKIDNDSKFDPRTVLAALGTLATLTREPRAAKYLTCCHPRFLGTLANLLSVKSIDFVHRATFILYNCLSHDLPQTAQNISNYPNLKTAINSIIHSSANPKTLYEDISGDQDFSKAQQIKELAIESYKSLL